MKKNDDEMMKKANNDLAVFNRLVCAEIDKKDKIKKIVFIILVALIIILAAVYAFSQDTNNVSDIRVTKTYIGLVGVGAVDTNYNFKNSSSSMVAASVEAKFNQDWRFNVNLVSLDNFSQTIGHYYLQYGSDQTTWMIKAGQLSRMISFHRPNPVSPGMQFEPASKAIIPGASLGGAVWLNYNGGQVLGGLFRAKSPTNGSLLEYDLGFAQSIGDLNLRLSGFYSQIGQGIALATTFKGSELSVYTDKDSLASTFVNLNSESIGWKLGSLYLDQIYDFKRGRFNRLEVGWYDIYKVTIAGLAGNICFGFGWRQYPERSFRLYIWPYIFQTGGAR